MPLKLVAQFTPREGQTAALRAALTELVAPIRSEEGCEAFEIYVGALNPDLVLCYEVWASREHAERHMQALHMKRFMDQKDTLAASMRVFVLDQVV